MYKRIGLLLFLMTIFVSVMAQKHKRWKQPFLSISLPSYQKDSMVYSCFNIGLIGHVEQIDGIGFNLFSSFSVKNVKGVMWSGLSNFVGRDLKGYQHSFLCNLNLGKVKGVSSAVVSNYTVKETVGFQGAIVLNYSGQLKGAQLAGVTNIAENVDNGFQFAVMNIARKGEKIVQVGMTNVCDQSMKGTQIGLVNVAQEVTGVQIGVLNLAMGKIKGVQIGLINNSADTTALKIGLISVTPKTRIQMMPFIGNRSKFNLAVRFLNHHHYTIVGGATHYRGLDDDFSGSLFYRTGWRVTLFPKCWISADAGFVHIENFRTETDYLPERMYALQGCVNLEMQLSKKLGLFVSGGYSWARFYKKNKTFERKPIFELGVLLF